MVLHLPEGKRFALALQPHFDAHSVWMGSLGRTDVAALARGEFGAEVGTPRLLDTLARYGVDATWCIPGHTAMTWPDRVRQVRDAGHEIAAHGCCHERVTDLPRGREVALMDKQLQQLEDVAGPPSPILEFPVSWYTEDWAAFEHLPGQEGMTDPDVVLRRWCDTLAFGLERCSPGALTIVLHPQTIGRPHHLLMLERFIEHVLTLDEVWVTTLSEIHAVWDADPNTTTAATCGGHDTGPASPPEEHP